MTELSDRLRMQRQLYGQAVHPSGERMELSIEETEGTVPERFAKIVAVYPGHVVFSDLEHELTYAELDRASNRCAHALLERRGPGSEPVVISMQGGPSMLVAIYGVMKAGKFRIMVEPDTPPEQMAFILRDLNDPVVIADDHGLDAMRRACPEHTAILGADEAFSHPDPGAVATEITADTLYMLRYTSGSTGRPKGVVHKHRDHLHFMGDLLRRMQLSAHDKVAGYGDGDGSQTMTGGTYYGFDVQRYGFPTLLQKMLDHAITVLNTPTTAFRQLIRSAGRGLMLPHLRFVLIHGEPPTPADILSARDLVAPDCIFCNSYGTTESYTNTSFLATVATAQALDSLPAGYPAADKEILLLDDERIPILGDEIGEIAVRSRYLSPGYWNLPELTAARFLPDPDGGDRRIYVTGDLGRLDADGCLHYVGRKDHMVKVRGHQVEVTAVEDALRAIEHVRNAAVVTRTGPVGDLHLVAYLETVGPEPTVSALRQQLSQRFPVTPAQYVFLDKLPLTPTNKVDRRRLPEPDKRRPHLDVPFAPPRTPVEELLAGIWAEVLGLEQVGIHDNFLDLGGDSLLASQVITRVVTALRVNLPLSALYAAPSVADMTLAVLHEQSRLASSDEIERLLAEVDRVANGIGR